MKITIDDVAKTIEVHGEISIKEFSTFINQFIENTMCAEEYKIIPTKETTIIKERFGWEPYTPYKPYFYPWQPNTDVTF